ncbi:MAG: acyltransferase [Ghiorsea sp.]
MTLFEFFFKVKKRLFRLSRFLIFQYPRILKYKILSTCSSVQGTPRLYQPVIFEGLGQVVFGRKVSLGVMQSPYYYTGYIYIDARNSRSKISFGDNVWINNNCVFVAEGEGISIGDKTLIGTNCEFIDSDFHDLRPDRRMGGDIKMEKILIGRNVFIGSNVKVLKGVSIGNNSVIANGSIVTKAIPADVIAAGVPAKVIRKL